MRRFIVIGHTVPAEGDWGLDDLPGAAGRVDVLCRAVTAALFTSHGIRADTEVVLVLPHGPVAIRFRGDRVQHLNPDERSTAARIRNALRHRGADPWWEEVEAGIDVAPFSLEDVVDGDLVVLDRDGQDILDHPLPRGAWVLSDHRPFTDDEQRILENAPRVSLGPTWYHGHHAVHVVQFVLDRGGSGG